MSLIGLLSFFDSSCASWACAAPAIEASHESAATEATARASKAFSFSGGTAGGAGRRDRLGAMPGIHNRARAWNAVRGGGTLAAMLAPALVLAAVVAAS